MQSVYAEFDQTRADFDHMHKLTCALEAYSTFLTEDIPADSAIGKAISLGIESIDPSLDLKEGSYVTLRAIKEALIKVAKATRELIRILFEVLGNVYVKFTGSLGRVRGHQKNAARRLGRLGNRVTYKEMEISGIQRLSVNGTFVGHDPRYLDEIRNIAEYLLNKHPASVVKVARVTSRRFIDLVEANPNSDKITVARAGMELFLEALKAAMSPIQGEQPVKTGELSAGWTTGKFNRSEVMPGNWALVYSNIGDTLRQGSGGGSETYSNLIKQAFKIDFVELSLNTADRAPKTMAVPTIQVLRRLVDGVSKILDVAEKSEAGRRDFNTVKTVVDDTIRQVMDVRDGNGNANSTVIQMLGAVSETLAAPMGNFSHWVAVTMNVYLNFIDHCIKHYEAEGV